MSSQIQKWMTRAGKEGYFHRCTVALDICFNVICGGKNDETISSRVYRVWQTHPSYRGFNPGVWLSIGLNSILNLIQKDHGAAATSGDLEREETAEAQADVILGLQGKK